MRDSRAETETWKLKPVASFWIKYGIGTENYSKTTWSYNLNSLLVHLVTNIRTNHHLLEYALHVPLGGCDVSILARTMPAPQIYERAGTSNSRYVLQLQPRSSFYFWIRVAASRKNLRGSSTGVCDSNFKVLVPQRLLGHKTWTAQPLTQPRQLCVAPSLAASPT